MLRLTRFLLIGLLVAMLPLRGWAGDIMAVDMVTGAASKLAMTSDTPTAVAAAPSQASMPPDCMMSVQPLPDSVTHCSNCDTCELCLAVVNPTAVFWSAGQWLRHSSPLATNASFTSAGSASNFKPPIS